MQDPSDAPTIELVKVAPNGARRLCRLSVDGVDLVTAAGPAGKPLKAAAKTFADTQSAIVAYEKSLRAKLRDGFAYVRDVAGAAAGDVVLRAFASGAGAGVLLDLSPDGRRAVTVGSDASLTAYWVELIDVATGARREVLRTAAGPRQGFVHAVFFDATGESIYLAVREETQRIDLATGAVTAVASYREGSTARFNPFVVRPHTDGARRRVVVFDAGTRVRVLERDGRSALDVCTDSPTTECRAAGISPSGKRLALYRVSRGIVYGHDDAKHDDTSVVEVWDVDAGAVCATIPFARKLDRVGVGPDDATLLVTWEYAQGPVAYDLATGHERWRFDDPHRADRLDTAHAWAHSPDGALLAVGRRGTHLYDAETREARPLAEARGYRTGQLRFSDDGALLASAEDGACVVRRVR